MMVYAAYNKIDGTVYIGKTTRSLNFRKAEHQAKANKGSKVPFHQAIREYGKEAFDWEILSREARDADHLNSLEKLYIKSHLDLGKAIYNQTEGGDDGKAFEAARQKMSASSKGIGLGRKTSPETIAKQKAVRRTEAHKDAIKQSNSTRILECHKPFEVYDLKTNELVGRYIKKIDCSRELGISLSCVNANLSGRILNPNRFYFVKKY